MLLPGQTEVLQLDDAHLDPRVGDRLLHLLIGTLSQGFKDLATLLPVTLRPPAPLERSCKDPGQDKRRHDHNDKYGH